jgi:hypothetical protein
VKKTIGLFLIAAIIIFMGIYYARAGTLEFDDVPVDITTSASEDLVIVPGTGGNTQIGDASGTNTNASSNDDIHVTGIVESDGKIYADAGMTSAGSVLSATDSANSLGSSSAAWLNLYTDYVKTVSATNLTILPTSAYTVIGDAGTAGSVSANDDLFVSGALETDGVLYADGGVSATAANLALNPASGYGLTGSVTRSAATGNEAAYDLGATINKATSGDYTGLKLNVTETSAPGTADKLIDLQVGGTSKFSVDNSGNITAAGVITGTGFVDGSGTENRITKWSGSSTLTDSGISDSSDAVAVTINSSENVGIGVTSPGTKLEVAGTAHLRGSSGVKGLYVKPSGSVGIGTITPMSKLDVEGAVAVGATYSGTSSAPSNGMIIEGNVGIGTTTVSQKLTVDGNILQTTGDYLATDRIRAINNSGLKLYDNGSNGIFIKDGGNVGIGDITPDGQLDIDFASTATTGASEYASNFTVADTGVVTSGTDTTYGAYIDLDRTGATGGTINSYGVYIDADGDGAGAGGTQTVYGVYADAAGGDTNYPGYFTGGPVMITDGTHTVNNADSSGHLFVDGDLEVDGTIYGSVSAGIDGSGTANYVPKFSDANTLADSVIYDDGTNVGIGSTSPAQKLHVEGQCIAGDSMLTIVPAGVISEQEAVGRWPLAVIEKRIVDVKMGEYTVSLNEETGQLEPRKIKGLLDMGVKPVFRLTTEDGRTIRTTGNHPYLIKERGITDEQRREISVRRLESLAGEHGIHGEDISEDREFSQVRAIWVNPTTTAVGGINMLEHIRGTREISQQGIHTIPIQREGFTVRNSNLSEDSGESKIHSNREDKGNQSTEPYNLPPAQRVNQITETKWLKVIELEIGDYIVVTNSQQLTASSQSAKQISKQPTASSQRPYVLWDKITSIEYVGYEQVYDIEVEGTHNFVANGILAHNTYISGNVGIGTTAPSSKLEVVDGDLEVDHSTSHGVIKIDSASGYDPKIFFMTAGTTRWNIGVDDSDSDKLMFGTNEAVPTSPLVTFQTDGNVGIGTTAPNSLLDVQAAAGSAGTATLSTAELTVVDGDKLGQIDFQAPLESDGTDAVLVGASIWAEADDTFAADNNATELVFATGASEVAAEKVRITSDGNVGIGTTAPNNLLEIVGGSGGVETDLLQIRSNVTTTNTGSTIRFVNSTSPTTNTGSGEISLIRDSSSNGNFYFRNSFSSVMTDRMIIQANGNVGIGTTGPDAILDVTEDAANATVNISSFHDTEATTPLLTLRKADNTEASPATIDQNAVLGTVNFDGYDDDGFDTGAAIYAKADASWSGTERGTALYFQTRDGSGSLTDQLTIGADGTATFTGAISSAGLTPGGNISLADNEKLLLGTGDDASLYYDGSDLYIDPQEVGSGDVIINAGNVGIGTTAPGYTLQVAGSIDSNIIYTDSGAVSAPSHRKRRHRGRSTSL